MKTVSVADAKAHLSELLALAEAGEDVLITRRGRPAARLVAEPGSIEFDWPQLRAWTAGKPRKGPTLVDMRDQDLL